MILWYAQVRLFRHLAHKHNFWNRSTFLKKHQILSRSPKESFSGNSVKISDCRAFSPFKILPGCRAFRHSVNFSRPVAFNRGPAFNRENSVCYAYAYSLVRTSLNALWCNTNGNVLILPTPIPLSLILTPHVRRKGTGRDRQGRRKLGALY